MASSSGSDDEFCTTREAAKRLGVSLRTAQLWSESGVLQAWKTEGGHRRISLASVELARERSRARGAKEPPAMGQLKVLVVEDDNVLLKLYRMRLTSWGMPIAVLTASNGYEALVLTGRESPDLMITDLGMEGIDGFQMVRTLMNSPFKDGMEIVVVSGLEQSVIDARGGLPAGVAVYAKPVPFEQMRGLCGSLLERRRQGMAAS